MNGHILSRTPQRMSWAVASLAVVAATWTVLDPGLLHGPRAMVGSARGTALVVLAVAVPVLLVSARKAIAGRAPAVFTWIGSLLYLQYNAVLLLFLTPFNAAFLLYVAMLATSLWSVGTLAFSLDAAALARGFSPRAPVRTVSVYTWAVVVLNAAAWLAVVVPALRGPFPPSFLAGTGVATNAVYVQDLAVWLPLGAVAAWWLWRREVRGLVVVPSLLALWAMESISIAVDQWWGSRLDPESTVVSATLVAPFVGLALVAAVPLVLILRRFDGSASAMASERRPVSPSADARAHEGSLS
ncbi:hypothetical protein [Pedococcus sp. 5OH_020]|uniref:hypothetical protein n=1 Tax=Pedococcus sp. 5OH_020 TaxID=2989814 RepID=UPI0022E9BA58|nr:hypothetical protein [Pedococcus sp. 5OH_020]